MKPTIPKNSFSQVGQSRLLVRFFPNILSLNLRSYCNVLSMKGDTIFMSPPWGGPDYAKVHTYDIGTMLKPHDGYNNFFFYSLVPGTSSSKSEQMPDCPLFFVLYQIPSLQGCKQDCFQNCHVPSTKCRSKPIGRDFSISQPSLVT